MNGISRRLSKVFHRRRNKASRLIFHRLSYFSLPDIREDVTEPDSSTVSCVYSLNLVFYCCNHCGTKLIKFNIGLPILI